MEAANVTEAQMLKHGIPALCQPKWKRSQEWLSEPFE